MKRVGLSLAAGVLTVLGVISPASPSWAWQDTLVCSPSANGGTLVNGVCVLPSAQVGQSYEAFIQTSNNSGGTFSIIAGQLPPGLLLSHSPPISTSGTPTSTGTFSFTVKVTDGTGAQATKSGSITVS